MSSSLFNAIAAITDKNAQAAVIRAAVSFAYRQLAVSGNRTPFEEIGGAKFKGRKALFTQAALAGLNEIKTNYKGSLSYKELAKAELEKYTNQLEPALRRYDEELARLESEAAEAASARKARKAEKTTISADTSATDTSAADTSAADTSAADTSADTSAADTLRIAELQGLINHVQALTGLNLTELSGLESPDEFRTIMLDRWGIKTPTPRKAATA